MVRAMVVGMLLAASVAGCGGKETQAPAATTSPAGKVLEVAGAVSATRNGATRTLAANTEVFADDVVAVGSDGSVVIELAHNGARWSLEAGLTSRVDESVAWGLDRQAAAKLVEHATSAAGRPANRQAADTKESAVEAQAERSRAVAEPTANSVAAGSPPPAPPVAPPKADPKPAAKASRAPVPRGAVGGSVDGGAKSIDAPPAGDALPEQLSRADIQTAIARIKPRVQQCGEQHAAAKGAVKVTIKIGPDGSVTSATVLATPDAALGDCVVAALKTATFAKSRTGATVAYPFNF